MHPSRRQSCLALLGLAAGALLPAARAAEPQLGTQYLALPTPRPPVPDGAADAGKVEVIEFFAYYCSHCYAFEPALAAWLKKQGGNVVLRRVHVARGARVLPQQRLFYTLDALGLLDRYHAKVFDAMHVERLPLASDEEVFDWVAKNGIDRAKFVEAYRSFGIQAKLRRAGAMMDEYAVDRWPMVVVDGRWITSPSHAAIGAPGALDEAGLQQAALQVMDHLVAKARTR